jgi:hypothetical protein
MSAEEKEIFSCHTGLAVGDEFFCRQQHMREEDLLPVIYSLAKECDGKIKQSGIYAFRLQIVRMK